jgi:uncharacterized protein
MNVFYLDTSALVKRYHEENGTIPVNRLLDSIISGASKGVISSLALLETLSAINRKRSEGMIDRSGFEKIVSVFYEELHHLKILSIDDRKIASSIPYIMKYNLNSADSLHLTTALSEKPLMGKNDRYFFVCCDNRLLKAARKEKLKTVNPETITEPVIGKL